MRKYLMHEHYRVISANKPENTDITSSENVNGKKIIYHMPWFLTFWDSCEASWWVPKPAYKNEMRKATMLEF